MSLDMGAESVTSETLVMPFPLLPIFSNLMYTVSTCYAGRQKNRSNVK